MLRDVFCFCFCLEGFDVLEVFFLVPPLLPLLGVVLLGVAFSACVVMVFAVSTDDDRMEVQSLLLLSGTVLCIQGEGEISIA